MGKKAYHFIEAHQDIFGRLLELLWDDPVVIKESVVKFKKGKVFLDFTTLEEKKIRMKTEFDIMEYEQIARLRLFFQTRGREQFLGVTFMYVCPKEMELCNQYGLYSKEHIEEMNKLQHQTEIREYRKQHNLLGNNQFFIFNMLRVEDHCADPVLDQIVQDLNDAILEIYKIPYWVPR